MLQKKKKTLISFLGYLWSSVGASYVHTMVGWGGTPLHMQVVAMVQGTSEINHQKTSITQTPRVSFLFQNDKPTVVCDQ
jgi:hypothetical protein